MTEANDAGTTGEHLVAAAKEGGNAVTHAVGRFADVVSSAVRRSGGNGAAQAAADGGARAADGVSRDATNLVRQAAEATGETQREMARPSAEGMAELGKLYAELLDEQFRHNQRLAAAIGQAVNVDWDGVLRAQGEFVEASLARVGRLNARHLEIVRAVLSAASAAARR